MLVCPHSSSVLPCAELLKHPASYGKVTEVQDLQHLEALVDKAGSSLVVVFFYTRSCGVCKALLQDYQQVSLCSASGGAGHHCMQP